MAACGEDDDPVERHGRLRWWRPEELAPDARALYERIAGGQRRSERVPVTDSEGRLQGPFNAMLASPAVGEPLQQLGAALRYRTALDGRSRELAILWVAADARSPFEWHAHEAAGRAAGLTEEEMSAVREGRNPASLAEHEVLALDVTRALVARRDLDDAVFERAETGLGPRRLMELVVLVGYYQLLALSLRVWRTPLPPGAASPFAPQTSERPPST